MWLYGLLWGYGDRPSKMAPMFSIENILICRLGGLLQALVPIG